MTSKELAREIATVVLATTDRVVGIGAEQYASRDSQKFENMPLPDLYDMAMEELEDTVAYAVMLRIRLTRLKEALDGTRQI